MVKLSKSVPKQASNIVLIGKAPRVGGTTFLQQCRSILESVDKAVLSLSFECSSYEAFEVMFKMVTHSKDNSTGLTVLLDEITTLGEQDMESLASLMEEYQYKDVKFICVGTNRILGGVCAEIEDSECYLLLRDTQIDNAFILEGDNGNRHYSGY